ncbi:biopolymer transport protein ExbD [Prosthecobacter debontii]|jgi:biopolymer transport protein ExbD|uniref:Biopolymer transport protein ExbD n=1 Tax=Prosthecobacter debontii TaxID=48467 RepID=A0A1T4YKR3_9BACT|nr:biopolymer transporter ExbD [Prosthecobacter debontii]SKB02283.1 biopolymer transport protein ExbD [Prosthecobacter debontii]
MNFRKQHSIEPTPMQLAPLVDVLFLLVIFFAVTSHYAKNEQVMDISVPAADEGQEKESRNVGEIIINIKTEGEIIVNGQQITEEELLVKLRNIASIYKDQAVILRGDEVADYKYVINVLNTCQKAGIWNIAFATRKPETEAPKN